MHRDLMNFAAWEIIMLMFPPLPSRIKFTGNYEGHECRIELTGVTAEDAGEWSCEMEKYVWGSIRGTSEKRKVFLTVVEEEEEEEIEEEEEEPELQGEYCRRKYLRGMRKMRIQKQLSRFRGWRNELDDIFVKSHRAIHLNRK